MTRDDNNGHYEFDRNGGKSCFPGWQNEQTNCTERKKIMRRDLFKCFNSEM